MCFHRRPDCDIGFSGENLFFSSADYGLALASRCDLNKKFKFVLPKRTPPVASPTIRSKRKITVHLETLPTIHCASTVFAVCRMHWDKTIPYLYDIGVGKNILCVAPSPSQVISHRASRERGQQTRIPVHFAALLELPDIFRPRPSRCQRKYGFSLHHQPLGTRPVLTFTGS